MCALKSCFFALSQLNIVLQDPSNREEQDQEAEAAPRDILQKLSSTSLSSAVYRMLAKCVTVIMPLSGYLHAVSNKQLNRKKLRLFSASKKSNEAGGTHTLHTHTHTGVRDGDPKMRVKRTGTPHPSMTTPRVWGRTL